MSVTAGVFGQASPVGEEGGTAGQAHLTALERAFGRIFTVIALLTVLQFWLSSRTLGGQTPGSVTANLLMSLLMIWQAISAFRRAPTQRDLNWLAAGTGVLLLTSRILAVPGSPFLENAAYLLVAPVVAVWAALSRHYAVPVPILLIVLATGAWHPRGDLPVEQAVTTLATAAFSGIAARFLRGGARRADKDAGKLSQQLAGQDAVLAAEEAERRAATAVHDDVISVLRAVSMPDQPLSWSVLVSKAQRAQYTLAAGGRSLGGLGPALHVQVLESTAGLDVHYVPEGNLNVPPAVVAAISAASGEALRNVAAHAQIRNATVMARGDGAGGVKVTISDKGVGFNPDQVGPTSTGLRSSIRGRLQDVGGSAEVISSPGEGTTVVLTWHPPQPADVQAADLLAWARRLAPSPLLIFLGYMSPQLLSGLVLLCLRWHDMRWRPAAVAVFLALLGLAAASARNINRLQMTRQAAVGLAAALTTLVTLGSLAVAPGTTDAFAYWVSGESTILVAVIYFLQGPAFGLAVLALDLSALMAGILVTGNAIPRGAWVGILGTPVLAAGLAVGHRAAFRGLSNYTERQLDDYRELQRLQARVEATSRVDRASLENARRVAGPVLNRIATGGPPDATLHLAADLASAVLRDELLAPHFLTPALADLLHAARTVGVRVTVNIAPQENTALTESARRLIAAALADPASVTEATLQMHPPTEEQSAALYLHIRGPALSDYDTLRECARDCGARLTDLADHALLVRLEPGSPEM